jgi:hypothetical protein
MSDLILHGNINADGSISTGAGFKIIKLGTGLYMIDFDQPFAKVPTVVLTQNYRTWDDFSYAGGYLTDGAVLVAVNTGQAKVLTGAAQSHVDRNFCFVAIGPT